MKRVGQTSRTGDYCAHVYVPTMPRETLSNKDYAERLVRLQNAGWKKLLDVQAPYRRNLRRLEPGFVLEIGCGIGRNLEHLGGSGVGIDTNPYAVEVARENGLQAFTSADFAKSAFNQPERFDSLLLSHVAEHMTFAELAECVRGYLPALKHTGRILLITPQEVGYRSDPTHVEFMDFAKLAELLQAVGFEVERSYSFPFPRWIGKLFVYNEFVVVGRRVGA
jgi:SAM-dependent methyltransferase